ncbi:MAG: CHAT domain-containing protein [Oscillatoriales cyanobacterium]|nr:MAG: CHAT domain-containing protein [Oscillatoriales cyanobacterium]
MMRFWSAGLTALALVGAIEQPGRAASLDDPVTPANVVNKIETLWEGEYEQYFDRDLPASVISAAAISQKLRSMEQQTGQRSALIYAMPRANDVEVVLVTAEGEPRIEVIPGTSQAAIDEAVKQLTGAITSPIQRNAVSYLPYARRLHDWIIAPIESQLRNQKIDLLIFCLGNGLRSAPLAAMHDGQRFLIEKYAIARIPGFSLLAQEPGNLKRSRVLAMGASEFEQTSNLAALPGVPVELQAIAGSSDRPGLWPGRSFLNRTFTLATLRQERQANSYGIVHLATHAEFKPGKPDQSYIQFWRERLTLDRIQTIDWTSRPVELLVLSACRTAVGDRNAELGFAGMAIASGVKSSIASTWYVSDRGTLALMNEFYRQLRTAPTKSEALRQAQLALLRGQVQIEGNELRGTGARGGTVFLPPDIAANGREILSHPYYWAAFSVIGNPW